MSERILLLFNDDSTLFFAIRMRHLLSPLDCEVKLAWVMDKTALSDRQLAQNLPEGPDLLITASAFKTPLNFSDFDAIITSRVFAPLRDMMRRKHIKMAAQRPVMISFQGGLDFTPERGFQNRAQSDAVFIVPASDIPEFRDYAAEHDFGWQYVAFGHPTFIKPKTLQRAGHGQKNLYFFAQAISPLTLKARLHMLDILITLAKRDPERDVYIKLRHLPTENRQHLHREEHDYPGLLKTHRPDAPPNLKLTACTMDEAIEDAAIGITCTSTAAIDLVRAGVPVQVYLDYVENYLDPLEAPMRRLFEGSNLIATLPEVMEGKIAAPDPAWLDNMFCPDDLGSKVLEAISSVRKTAIRVETIIPPLPAPGE